MSLLHYLLYFLLAIGLLIVVHEFGHYAAARLCGVKVLRFSLGFGPQLLMRRFGPDRTEWSLAAVPLGGYVKMLDEREGAVDPSERHRAFNTQSVIKRSIIVLAGPLSNLLFAVLIFWGMACYGARDFPAVIGLVESGSLADKAGLMSGDKVVRFGGVGVIAWGDLRWQAVLHALGGQHVAVDVIRDGALQSGFILDMTKGLLVGEKSPDQLRQLGISLPVMKVVPVIGRVLSGKPAARAGFREGDRILAVDARPMDSLQAFVACTSVAGKSLNIQLERDGRTFFLDVVPETSSLAGGRGQIGAEVRPDAGFEARNTILVRYGLVDGAGQGLRQTWSTAIFSLKVMWHIIKGDVSARNVSGPVTIADYAGKSASAGMSAYIHFLAMVSISLGVLNLLPIPILDGGHLLYYVLESIRGRAVSARFEEIGQKLGLTLLAMLMVLAFFNDFNRVIFG